MTPNFTNAYHPVGEGVFYTENISINNDSIRFNVVCDCGSVSPKSQANLTEKIEKTFKDKECIDLLFVSRFDAKHTNGLELLKNRCTIKKVIIPLLDDEVRTLSRISLLMQGEDTTLLDDPKAFFGEDTIIIQVTPTTEKEMKKKQKKGESIQEYIIHDLTDMQVIESGDRIRIHQDMDWYYTPRHYTQKERITKLKKRLKKGKIKIDNIDWQNVVNNEVISTYRDISESDNLYSIQFQSGNEKLEIVC